MEHARIDRPYARAIMRNIVRYSGVARLCRGVKGRSQRAQGRVVVGQVVVGKVLLGQVVLGQVVLCQAFCKALPDIAPPQDTVSACKRACGTRARHQFS